MTKKLITLLLALTMVFACAVPVMADEQTITHQDPTLEQPVSSAHPTETGTFTVYLSVGSYSLYGGSTNYVIERQYYPVTMGADGVTDKYYVSDVLANAISQYPWLSLYYYTGTIISGTPPYVYQLSDTSVFNNYKFGHLGTTSDYNGWMFRINGQFRLINSSEIPAGNSAPYGASITQAYVNAGDRIDLVLCNANNDAYSTHWTLIDNITYTNNVLNFYIVSSDSYYDSNNDWQIGNYETADNFSCTVYVDGVAHTITTDANGKGSITFTGTNVLSAGTHKIYFPAGLGNYRNYSGLYVQFPYMTSVTVPFIVQ